MSTVSRSFPRALCLVLALGACAERRLSEAERGFLDTVQGPELDAAEVVVVKGALIGAFPMKRPARPQVACRERIWPPEEGTVEGRVAGVVVGERLNVARWFWTGDFLKGYPEVLPLPRAMYLAHEMTHVWQWQARAETGYAPWKAAGEHAASADPYLFEVGGQSFLDYGYEQQASLVEEYVCCRALDPTGARTERLRDMLRPVFPTLAETETAPAVRLPWKGAEIAGICS